MATPSLAELAATIAALQDQVATLNRASQLANSSVDTGNGSVGLSDAVQTAMDTPAYLLDLQARLDTNDEALAAARADVEAAQEAAQEASDAGVAAGELANAAADDALEKAQEALDAAAQAGGGATYTNRAPTSSDPGKPGQQWFVWDSTYHVTAYYVYQDDTVKWVQAVLDDGVFGNLSAGHITSGYIDAARIAAASLTAAVLAADTITSREIAANAILARNIKAAEITGDKIAARTIAAGNIVANTITAGEIKAGTITANEIAVGTITATQIAAGSITANEINLDTLNGRTLTGTIIQTSATGRRVLLANDRISFYNLSGVASGAIYGVDGDNGPALYLGASGGNVGIGQFLTGSGDAVSMAVTNGGIARLYTTSVYDNSSSKRPLTGVSTMPSMYGGGQAAQSITSGTTTQYLRPSATTETAGLTKTLTASDCYWTAPYDGFYAIHIGGVFASAANGNRSLEVLLDSAIVGRDGDTIGTTALGQNMDVGIPVVYVGAGQRIRMRVQQNSGNPINFTIDSLAIRYVGPV